MATWNSRNNSNIGRQPNQLSTFGRYIAYRDEDEEERRRRTVNGNALDPADADPVKVDAAMNAAAKGASQPKPSVDDAWENYKQNVENQKQKHTEAVNKANSKVDDAWKEYKQNVEDQKQKHNEAMTLNYLEQKKSGEFKKQEVEGLREKIGSLNEKENDAFNRFMNYEADEQELYDLGWDKNKLAEYADAWNEVHNYDEGKVKYLTEPEEYQYKALKIKGLDDDEKKLVEEYNEATRDAFLYLDGKGGKMLGTQYDSDILAQTTIDMAKLGLRGKLKKLDPQKWTDEKIDEYIEYISSVANRINTDQALERQYGKEGEVSSWKGIYNSLDSLMLKKVFGSSIKSHFNSKDNVNGFGEDMYSPLNYGLNSKEYARSVTQQTIAENHPNWAQVYGMGMSAAESAEIAIIGGKLSQGLASLGVAPKVASLAGKIVSYDAFATSAYHSQYKDARARGLSVEDAEKEGIASALTEILTEELPFENMEKLFSKSGKIAAKNAIKEFGKQAGLEGLEEIVGDISERFYDYAIAGGTGMSKMEVAIQNYMDKGDSYEEAKKKANWDWVYETAWDGISGVLSAVPITAVGTAGKVHESRVKYDEYSNEIENRSKKIAENSTDTEYGRSSKEMAERFAQNPTAYIAENIDDSTPEGKQQKEFLQKYADKVDSGKKLTRNDKMNIVEVLQDAKQAPVNMDNFFVPDEYKAATTNMSVEEGRKAIQDAIKANDQNALGKAYRDMTNSTSVAARNGAKEAMEQFAGMAQNAGLDVESAMVGTQEAYLKGLNGEEFRATNESLQIAYNEGEMKRLQENKRTIDSVSELEGNVQTIKGAVTLTKRFNEDGKIFTNKGLMDVSSLVENTNVRMAYEDAAEQSTALLKNVYLANIKDGDNLVTYKKVFESMMIGGANNRSFDSIIKDTNIGAAVEQIGRDRAEMFYNLGQSEYQSQTSKEAKELLNKAMGVKRKGTGTFSDMRTVKNTDIDSRLMSAIASYTGLDIVLADSKNTGEQASFNATKSVITIDENTAGQLFHELGEFTAFYNSEGYNALSEAVLELVAESTGDKYAGIVKHYRNTYQRFYDKNNMGKNESYLDASRELTNDAMVSIMSQNPDILANKLVEKVGTEQARTIGQKVKDFFDKIRSVIKNLFKNTEYSDYQQQFNETFHDTEKVANQFLEALDKAIENYHKEVVNKVGIDLDTEAGMAFPSEEYSLATWNESDYVKNFDEAVKSLAETLGVTEKEAENYINQINSVAAKIAKDAARLDYIALEDAGMLMDNAEYIKTVDGSTLCKKRLDYTDTLSEIQRAMPNTALTGDEMLEIVNMMQSKNYETPCGLCYVESTRKQLPTYAKDFLTQYAKENPGKYVPTMAEINTPDGLVKIRSEHKEVYDAYMKYMNKKGNAKPKLFQTRAAYQVNEITDFFKVTRGNKKVWNESRIHKFIENGGLRLQSYSDFEVVQMIDMMQVIMDLSNIDVETDTNWGKIKGMISQAYTKVPAFADIFGGTGVKINLSTIAKGVDANGNLIFDDVEGINSAEAKRIRNKYSDNVGIVTVVFNDEQLKAALTNSEVDYVLPFHRSSWSLSQAKDITKQSNLKDYTEWQNEKHPTKKISNIMPNTYWDFSKDGRANAERYLELCAEDGRKPKFSFLLENNNGKWSLPNDAVGDNYFKLLIDFKMYNNERIGAPQQAVRPNFDMEVANKVLDEYEGDHNKSHAHQDIVDSFVSKYKAEHGDEVMYSLNPNGDIDLDQYASSDLENWKDSPTVMVAKSQKDIVSFLDNELKSKDFKVLKCGRIPETLANRIFKDTGIDTHGLSVAIGTDYEDHHTNEMTEQKKWGQNAMTHDVIARVTSNLGHYLTAKETTVSKQGKRAIEFVIDDNGLKTIITFTTKNRELRLKTMYGIEKKNSQSVTNGVNAPSATTSKTNRNVNSSNQMIQQNSTNSNNYVVQSLRVDSEGNTLTEQQVEYFNDSKIVDENGNLKVMYHGTSNAGFTVFDGDFGISGRSFFFTDKNEIAKSYSGTKDLFTPIKTFEDLRNNIKKVDDAYEVIDDNGTYKIFEDGEVIASSDDLQTAYNEWNAYSGWGGEVSNYKTYLNVTNPLVVDAEYNSWQELEYKADGEVLTTTNAIADYARENGYDGVIFNNIMDSGIYGTANENMTPSTVVAVFESNQIKSVDNANPTDNDDIRYSMKVDSAFEATLDWEEANEYASILEDGAKEAQALDDKVVKGIANKLRKEIGSKYDADLLAENLQKAFNYMATNEHVNYSDMMRIFKEIATPVVEEVTEKVGEEEYRRFVNEMKGYKIALTESQMAEVKKVFGSYAEFKKRMSPLTISNNGVSLDSVWNEMVEASGYILDMDATSSDMPTVLYDTLQAMKPAPKSVYGGNVDDVAKDVAMRIVEEYLTAQNNTKAAEKIRKRKADVEKKLKEEYREKLKNAKQSVIENKAKAIAGKAIRENDKANREQNLARIAEIKARYKGEAQRKNERAEAEHQKRQIESSVKRLTKWIQNPTEKNHVPVNMVDPILDFTKALDFVMPDIKKTNWQSGTWSMKVYDHSITDGNGRRKPVYTTIEGQSRNEVILKYYDMLNEGRGSENARNWQQRMQKIVDLYNQARTSDDESNLGELLDVSLAAELKEVMKSKTVSINNLTSSELKVINNVLKNLENTINKQNAMLTDNKEITEIAKDTMNNANNSKVNFAKTQRREKLWGTFFFNMATPETFMHGLGEGAEKVYKSIRKGFNTFIRDIKQAQDFMAETMTGVSKKDLKKWSGAKSEVHHLDLSDGHIDITTAQIMSLYELNKRDQTLSHYRGGVMVERFNHGNTVYNKDSQGIHLKPEDLAKLFSYLTPKQIEIADKLQKYMATECAKQGNEVSKKMYGFEKFNEEHYFPLTTDRNYISTNNANDTTEGFNKIEKSGFTKKIIENASNPIIIKDIFDVFTDHVSQMASYHGYAPALKDAMRWYNYTEIGQIEDSEDLEYSGVKSAINKIYGKNGQSYFTKFIKDINQVDKSQYIGNFTDKLISGYKASAVAANMRVVIQQPTAYFRAANLINPVYLTEAMLPQNIAKYSKWMSDSEIAQWKSWGYYETSIGKSLKEIVTGQNTFKDKITNAAMAPAGVADDLTWRVLYTATALEQKAKNKGLSESELREKIKDRFDEMIDQTQVVDSTLHRSQYMRSKDTLNKLQTAFMAEPTKSYNMILRAWMDDYKKGGIYKKTVRAFATFAVTSMATAAAAALVDGLRKTGDDDDYEEVYLESLKEGFIDNVNPFNLMPVFKDVSSTVINMITGESTFGNSSNRMDLDAINELVDALDTAIKWWNGDSNKTVYGLVTTIARPFSQMTGIPAYNLQRDLVSIYNQFGEDLAKTVKKPNDKYLSIYKSIAKDDDIEVIKEKVNKAMGQEGTIYDVRKGISSRYKSDYYEALLVDEEEARAIADLARKGLMATGMTKEEADNTILSWEEDSYGYAEIDKAIQSGEGIYEAMAHLIEGKKPENIVKHFITRYEDTFKYNNENAIDSQVDENVEEALSYIGKSYSSAKKAYDDLQEAKAEAKEAQEVKAEAKQRLYNVVQTGKGDYKSAIKDMVEAGTDYKTIKSNLSKEQTKPLIKAYYNGNKSAYNQIRNIVTIRAYLSKKMGTNIAAEWQGDYYAYEMDQVKKLMAEYKKNPW